MKFIRTFSSLWDRLVNGGQVNRAIRRRTRAARASRSRQLLLEQLEDKSLLTSMVGAMAPSSHVPEGNGAIVYISVNPPTSTTVTVTYQTNAGTAIQDTDYDGITGSVTINPGQPYVAVSIPVYHDFLLDPGETFSVAITGATGATVNPANSSTTITIDDVPPPAGSGTLWITPTVSHNEGSNQGALTE
jgi:hypothetical protein